MDQEQSEFNTIWSNKVCMYYNLALIKSMTMGKYVNRIIIIIV